MYIYHSKLCNGNSYNHALAGNFSGLNRDEIIVSCNSVLELYIIGSDGTYFRMCCEDLFARIRSMAVMQVAKNTSKNKDYVAVGSDSGHALILAYDADKNGFIPILKTKYAMPVSLPEIPGQYVATSFFGMAVGSLVENHIFYSIYRCTQKDIENIEPLFVNQPKFITYDIVGVKTPNAEVSVFVSLEVLCEEKIKNPDDFKQHLKVYQVEFQKKNVMLTSEVLPEHGNMLISVPKGKQNPIGIIICFPNKLTFKALLKGYKDVTRILPQRKHDAFNSKRGFILTSSVVHEVEGNIVVFAQSEQGDLFSIKITEGENKILSMKIIYMDTIPVASGMCMVSGRLFIAAEFGDNFLYEIKSFGNESEMIPFQGGEKLFTFYARKLENLSVVKKMGSISPVMQACVSDLACNDLKKFIFACGRGPSSTLRFQRFGVQVSTVFETVLPPLSNAVWTVNQEVSPGHTVTYILVSLMGRTMVLALDKILKIDYDTGFCSKVPTLGCAQCSKDSIIQVNHNGIRHIRSNHQYTEKVISERKSERFILRCALHGKQIAVALVNKEGLYFEVEDVNGQIHFRQVQMKTKFNSTVMCMGFIPRIIRAKYLVVCLKDTLEIYSVNLSKMECLTTYKLERIPESLAVVSCMTNNEEFNSIINIGFDDGYLQRLAANEEKIMSEYSLKLGNKAVKLYIGKIRETVSVLALTNKAWISFYPCSQIFTLAPMDIDPKNDFSFISASSCPAASLVAISRKLIGQSWETKLHFLSVNNSVTMIEDDLVKLTYTPKALTINPKNNFIIINETDERPPYHKVDEMNPQKAMDLALEPPKSAPEEGIKKKKPFAVWDSQLRIFDPTEKTTVFIEPLPRNIAAVSMSLVQFGKKSTPYLLVGTQQGRMIEGINRESEIYMYEITEDGKSFSLVDKTVVEDIASAICQIENHVLIGVGKLLCLYRFKESSKTLRRCKAEESLYPILAIWARNNFFIVETVDEILTYGYLEVETDSLIMIHQERYLRNVSCLCFWDDDIIFVADRKNISVVLLPYYEGCREESTDEELEELGKELDEAMKLLASQEELSSEDGPSTSKASTSFQAKPSPSKASTSFQAKLPPSKAKPSLKVVETNFKIRSKARITLPASEAGPSSQTGSSSQASLSASRGGPSSQAGPSTSRAGSSSQASPSASRASPSSQAGPDPSKPGSSMQTDPLPSTAEGEKTDIYRLFRITATSNIVITHKVGEFVRSIQKTSLMNESRELIMYTTMSGLVGVIVPRLNETHHKFFGPLEYLTFKINPLLTADWLVPLRPELEDIIAQCRDPDQVTVDGNAIEVYCKLPRIHQHSIASRLRTTFLEVLQTIEEMKTTIYF